MSQTKLGKKQILSILAAFLVVTSASAYLTLFQPSTGNKTTLTCYDTGHCNLNVPLSVDLALNVSVYKSATNHTLVANRYLPHDLILNNFYTMLTNVLNNAQSGQTITASVKNTAGSLITWGFWGNSQEGTNGGLLDCSSGNNFICALPGQGGLIEVGTSNVAATRADSALTVSYQSFFLTSSLCSQSSTDSVVVTGSENANSGTTLQESGLFMQTETSGVANTVMMAHDVFSGIVVSGGNTITVQYTWSLNNVGFNYNLCELLAAYFTQPNGLLNTVKSPAALMVFFDTLGRNVSWTPLGQCGSVFQVTGSYYAPWKPLASSNPSLSTCSAFASGDTQNTVQVAVGTGSSAFTPASRSLNTFYAQNYITNVNYDGAGNGYETANVLLATGATISEAAIYVTMPKGCIGYSPNHLTNGACITSYGTDTIMLLAATFTGQVVPNGQSIGITFQESG